MRNRRTTASDEQLAFDFTPELFEDSEQTIQPEPAAPTPVQQPGENDVDFSNPAARERSPSSPAEHDDLGSPVPIVHSSGLEDPGSLGAEQPRQAPLSRGAGGADVAGSSDAAAGDRAAGSHSSSTDGVGGPFRDGNHAAAGDPHGPVVAQEAAHSGDGVTSRAPRGDFTITEAVGLGQGGPKAKFRDNVAAIKLLHVLRSEEREPTDEECLKLVRYVGWGGLPQAFDSRNEEWRSEYHELGALLKGSEYEQARRSTQDAHYTSEVVIRGIYQGLERIGFRGGKVLEPASGTGHFIGLMPDAMRGLSSVTAIELDPTTSAVGQQLYPNADHVNRGFQDVVIPAEHFDLVIGNPPFGNQSLYDPFHRELGSMSIHNFFLAKSIDKLRPGGILAVVVSRYFMDSVDRSAREHIAARAELLGAIRLPNTAFKRNALTEVTTDVLFFRKLDRADAPMPEWTRVGELPGAATGAEISVNRYFCDHPGQMAGTMAISHKMHRDAPDLIANDGEDLASAFAARLEILPKAIYRERAGAAAQGREDKAALRLPDSLKVGAFFLTPEDRLARRLPDLVAQHDYVHVDGKSARTCERIRGMIEIRDQLRGLLSAEQSVGTNEPELQALRTRLNRTYDAFLERNGHISSQANRLALGEDPELRRHGKGNAVSGPPYIAVRQYDSTTVRHYSSPI